LKCGFKSSKYLSLLLLEKTVEMEINKNRLKSNVSTLEWVRRY